MMTDDENIKLHLYTIVTLYFHRQSSCDTYHILLRHITPHKL